MCIRDRTEQSRGYGLITFSSFQAASKARRKYTGTHLCKKFQLRITHVTPDSSTFSNTPIPAPIHSDEAASNVSVSCRHEAVSANSVNAIDSVTSVELGSSMKSAPVLSSVPHLNRSEIEFPVFSISGASTSAPVQAKETSSPSLSDKLDATPLHIEKHVQSSSSSATDIVIENLSFFVEEGELKALMRSYGADVLSYNIQPDATTTPETCIAKVSLADHSQAATVINELHNRVLLRCKLRVFLADFAENKGKEPPTKIEQRKISLNLFQFISKHSHTQIELFKQKGGAFNYKDGSAFYLVPKKVLRLSF